MANAGATWCSAKASRMRQANVTPCSGCWGTRRASRKRKLHLGYRTARLLIDSAVGAAGSAIRGHEFHYARLIEPGNDQPLVELADAQDAPLGKAGGRRGHVTGTFFHAIARATPAP